MDLRNFETTSTYAMEAVYAAYYEIIPDKYRVEDPLLSEQEHPHKPHPKHPISITEVNRIGLAKGIEYENEIYPDYDPELNFSDRFHYRLSNIDYPKRANPWFIITWNFGKGLLKSSLTNRRFDSATCKNQDGDLFKFKFQNVDLDMTLALTSNSLQAAFELQENIIIGRRLQSVAYTRPHLVLGSFPVSFDAIESDITKYGRDKGTLCSVMLNLKLDFPIIGFVEKIKGGIIKEIHSEVDKLGTGPKNQYVYGRDIINENS